jgi:methionyl-tRNA synthetase
MLPIGYISATKEWALREGKNGAVLDQDTKLVHFIGKDNIVFTALFSCDVKSRRKLYFARQCACK